MLLLSSLDVATTAAVETAADGTTATPVWDIPSSIDMTVGIPKVTTMVQVIAAILMIAVLICAVVFTRKKFKMNMMAFIGGVATFILFFYYAPQIVNLLSLIPQVKEIVDGKLLDQGYVPLMILCTVLSTAISIGGRALCMVFYKKENKISSHVSVALGLLGGYTVYTALQCFLGFVNCSYVNSNGWEQALTALMSYADTQEAFNKSALDLYLYVSNGEAYYVILAFEQLIWMVLQFALTFAIATAFQNKESKWWYAFAIAEFGLFKVMQLLEYENFIPKALAVVLQVLITGVAVYFAYRKYKDYYIDEAAEEKEEEARKKNPPKKPMPKFDNLSNL